MTTDRAALEKAIARARELGDLHESWETLVVAAQAWADTLPRTKMVECFHVEYVSHIGGRWHPEVCARNTMEGARSFIEGLPHDSMARITGPHLQEVPST